MLLCPQALRIASTEPELQTKLQQQLKPLSLIATVAGTAGKATAAAVGSSSSSKQQQLGPGDDSSLIDKVLQGKQQQQQQGEEQEELLRRLELEEFDRKLQERLKE
jgi:hypothetical protein